MTLASAIPFSYYEFACSGNGREPQERSQAAPTCCREDSTCFHPQTGTLAHDPVLKPGWKKESSNTLAWRESKTSGCLRARKLRRLLVDDMLIHVIFCLAIFRIFLNPTQAALDDLENAQATIKSWKSRALLMDTTLHRCFKMF